jgi:hypothetical protein
VWVGIVENHLAGSYVLPLPLSFEYFMFLNEVLPELVEEIPLAIGRKTWYLHHWCTALLRSKRRSGNS